ncbi:MAG: hypothetical protein HY331_19140, partial [Chloroflexi bacterium]|nr:hypothetical protein [Chloroflexota bacterium]
RLREKTSFTVLHTFYRDGDAFDLIKAHLNLHLLWSAKVRLNPFPESADSYPFPTCGRTTLAGARR